MQKCTNVYVSKWSKILWSDENNKFNLFKNDSRNNALRPIGQRDLMLKIPPRFLTVFCSSVSVHIDCVKNC